MERKIVLKQDILDALLSVGVSKGQTIMVVIIPFASLKAQTSYEKCCAPPLFDL